MISKIQTWLGKSLLQFRDDARGATAIVFALLAIPVLGLSLAAIDYSRAQGIKAAIQTAADSAARAGANMLGSAPHSEIETAVRGYLKTNLPADLKELPFVLTFASDDLALTIKMNTTVQPILLGMVGVKKVDVAVATTIERPESLKQLQAPHRGVTPDLPAEVSKQLPGFNRNVSPDEMRLAAQVAERIMEELEQSGGSADMRMRQLLRELRGLR